MNEHRRLTMLLPLVGVMRIILLFIGVILMGACTMSPMPAAQPPPVTSYENVTAGWEGYQDPVTGWSFAFPPGSRVTRETAELPWYTLITPAADFPGGNMVRFGADLYAMPDDLALAQWVTMREAVSDRMLPLISGEWVMLDEDRADPQGLLLETHGVGLPSYVFYRVYGNLVITLDGPGTPEMASFLPQFASTLQLTDAALASAQHKRLLPADYQAAIATRQAVQSATPALDIVVRDATAIAQLTPGPPATYSPEMQTQEAIYYRSLETATAAALLTTPAPTPTSLPIATPLPSGRPGYALYQGPGTYHETPRLQAEYDMSQWSVSALDQHRLVNRQWPGCVLNLQGGPRGMLGPAVVEWINLGEHQWTRTDWRGDHVISYLSNDTNSPDMQNFLIELYYAAEASREDVTACRVAAEQVLASIEVLN